jgi:hypothetical protein
VRVVGVDIGGTFTDLALYDTESGATPAVQRRHMSPDCERFTLRLVRRTIWIIDSHGFVDCSVFLDEPQTPSRVTMSVSAIPSCSEAAAPGWERSGSEARERSSAPFGGMGISGTGREGGDARARLTLT